MQKICEKLPMTMSKLLELSALNIFLLEHVIMGWAGAYQSNLIPAMIAQKIISDPFKTFYIKV